MYLSLIVTMTTNAPLPREEYEGKRFTRQYTPVAVPEPENLRFKVLIKVPLQPYWPLISIIGFT